jgi:cell division protease FtsH
MVTRYGMSTTLGPIAYEQERGALLGSTQSSFGYPEQRDYGEVTATTIDEEVRRIVQAAFERTVALLKERREILELAARRLLEKETLTEHELLELVGTRFTAASLGHKADSLVDAPHGEQQA